MVYLIVDCLVALILFGIGVVTLLKNNESMLHRYFFWFSSLMACWVIINYFSNIQGLPEIVTRFANELVLLVPGLGLLFLYKFCLTISPHGFLRRYEKKWTIFSTIASLLTLTPLVVAAVSYQQNVVAIRFGILAPVYFFSLISNIVLSIFVLVYGVMHTRGSERRKITTILWSMSIFLVFNLMTNILLPFLAGSFLLTNLGPLSTVILVSGLAYAIIRHRLFDIRLAIVRALGFIISVGVVAGIYSLFIIAISTLFINKVRLDAADLLLLLPTTIFVALTFHNIQTVIGRLTRKFFYHDDYDLRTTLDQLSDILVSASEIETIMSQSLAVFSETIRPSNAYFMAFNEQLELYQGSALNRLRPKGVPELLTIVDSFPDNPVVTEWLADRSTSRLLSREGITIALRLGVPGHAIGLVVFGPKQNGRIYTKTDIALLRIGAKNLGIALQNAQKYEQISHFADTLAHEVDRATAKLRRANDRLKSLDALKDDFMSMASHQLRSPATSVHEALHMLNHPALNQEDRERMVALAEANSERLVTVVKTMLNMARLQAGRFTIDRTETDVIHLAERVIMQTGVVADQGQVKLSFQKPREPIIALVDAAKISEAMANYIENAIKYSPPKSTVHIKLTATRQRIMFEVTDAGMGVPVEEREKLFGKFYRASNARKQQPDGNGIGLFVVRNIVEGHGGETYFKPLKPGSLFGLWLPIQHDTKA